MFHDTSAGTMLILFLSLLHSIQDHQLIMESNKISKQKRKYGQTLTGNNKKQQVDGVEVIQPSVNATLPSD